MKVAVAALSALVFVAGAPTAVAGPVADAAAKAEALQGEGKTVEALAALDEAADAIWTSAPLAFRKVVLVDKAGALGAYTERKAATFQPDEKLSVYVEPVGFGYGGSASSATVGFTADLTIENKTGQVISEAKDLFSVTADSAAKRREFGMTLAFGVPYLRPGDYVARFSVRDQNSDKSGSFDVPFAVSPPGGAQPTNP